MVEAKNWIIEDELKRLESRIAKLEGWLRVWKSFIKWKSDHERELSV